MNLLNMSGQYFKRPLEFVVVHRFSVFQALVSKCLILQSFHFAFKMPRINYWYNWFIFDQSKKEEFWIPFFQPDIWWLMIRLSIWINYHLLNHILSLNISNINNDWSIKMNCRKEEFSIPKLKYKNLKFRFFFRTEKGKENEWILK